MSWSESMKARPPRKRLLFGLVILVGAGLVMGELYVLSGAVRAATVPVLAGDGCFDTLVGLLTDDDRDVGDAAQGALIKAGPRAVPALVRGLDSDDPLRRSSSAITLGRIGPPAIDAAPALRRRMVDDNDPDVRTDA